MGRILAVLGLFLLLGTAIAPGASEASSGQALQQVEQSEVPQQSGAADHGGAVSKVLLGLVIVLLAAKLGGDLALRMGQPEVLGELVVGVVLGNLGIIGFDFFEFLKHDEGLKVLSELGVILLLFEVGLETSVVEMLKVGTSSLLVAIVGVIAPFALGWGLSSYFASDHHPLVHIFVGATLTATSVGITARVLKDLGKIRTSEGKIILGAAVIDDVLGLVVLAVVTGMITATNQGTEMAMSGVAKIILLAVGFLGLAVWLGMKVSPLLFQLATTLRSHGILLATALSVCFGMSYLAALVGLAPIVGAFTAGLILEPVHYKDLSLGQADLEIDDLIRPITGLLVPVFFVGMGANVDITVFADLSILNFAFWLSLAAIAGKQVCGLGVRGKDIDRIAVGLGMIPRGEVGLIFAGIGVTLHLAGEPVINSAVYGAVIIMVIVTTMVTPPLIKWRFSSPRHRSSE